MNRYKIYGLILETEVEFKQLEPATEFDEDKVVRIIEEDVEEEVMRRLTEADALKCKYVIDLDISAFMNIGGYYLIRNGREILFKTKEGYTPQRVAVWLMGFSLTMALLQRGILAMHCSAISYDKGAFLVVGVPGAGKSSLTRVLIENGYKIMADDVAPVYDVNGQNVIYPAFPYQKLCRNEVEKRGMDTDKLIHVDSDKDKFLVSVRDVYDEIPRELKGIIMIMAGNVDELKVQKVTGFDTYRVIRENLFLHKLAGTWEGKPEVVNASFKIAGSVPIYLMVRPVGIDTLDLMKGEVDKIVESF